MKALTWVIQLALILVLSHGMAIAQPMGRGLGPGNCKGFGLGMTRWLSTELQLTQAQTLKVTAVVEKMQQARQSIRSSRSGKCGKEMADLFRANKLDKRKMTTLMEARQAEREKTRSLHRSQMVDLFSELHSILTQK